MIKLLYYTLIMILPLFKLSVTHWVTSQRPFFLIERDLPLSAVTRICVPGDKVVA